MTNSIEVVFMPSRSGVITPVSSREQGIELVLFDGLMATSGKSVLFQLFDSGRAEWRCNEIQATILAIDTAHELANLSFEFERVGKCRRSNLNKDDSTYPLKVVV